MDSKEQECKQGDQGRERGEREGEGEGRAAFWNCGPPGTKKGEETGEAGSWDLGQPLAPAIGVPKPRGSGQAHGGTLVHLNLTEFICMYPSARWGLWTELESRAHPDPCFHCILTNMARSSTLLGNSRRPPKRKVFCRFCSQALAIPIETESRSCSG